MLLSPTYTLKVPRTVRLKDLYKLEGLLEHVDDPQLAAVKQTNKQWLAQYVESIQEGCLMFRVEAVLSAGLI